MAASESVLDTVRRVAADYGVPEWIWRPIMDQESGGNPGSHNPNGEDSRGLFQINIKANPRFSSVDLYDPEKNAKIAMEYFIAPAWEDVKDQGSLSVGDKAAYVWKNGIRPRWTDQKNTDIRTGAYTYFNGSAVPASETTTSLGKKAGDFARGLFGFPASSSPSFVTSPGSDKVTILKDSWLTPGLVFSKENFLSATVTVILFCLGLVILFMFLKSLVGSTAVVIQKGVEHIE